MTASVDARLQNEVEHGRFLAAHGAGEVWNWATPAGKLRKIRVMKLLQASKHFSMIVISCNRILPARSRPKKKCSAQVLSRRKRMSKSNLLNLHN